MNDIKKSVTLPASTFDSAISSRLSVLNAKNLERTSIPDQVLFYEEENVYILGEQRTIKRLYVRRPDVKYVGVGWVINEDINFCMICAKQFGFFLYRHHCRSCGNLVCDGCSPYLFVLEELELDGEQRVCIQCYWGQDPVHVARWRLNSEYGDDIDDRLEDNESDSLRIHSEHSYSKLEPTVMAPQFTVSSHVGNSDLQSTTPTKYVASPSTPTPTTPQDPQPALPSPFQVRSPSQRSPLSNVQTSQHVVKAPEISSSSNLISGTNPISNPLRSANRNGSSQHSPREVTTLPSSFARDGLSKEPVIVIPVPGVVLKSKGRSGDKVFINICHSSLIPSLLPSAIQSTSRSASASNASFNIIVGHIRETTDKAGDKSRLIDVGINSERFKECMEATDSSARDTVSY